MAKEKKNPDAREKKPSASSFQCPVCGETFDTRQELYNHERTHRGEQIGGPGTSDRASQEDAGNLTEGGEKELPFAGERGGWTTGTGDREEGELTGRETPGGRNAGFSGDAGLDLEK